MRSVEGRGHVVFQKTEYNMIYVRVISCCVRDILFDVFAHIRHYGMSPVSRR